MNPRYWLPLLAFCVVALLLGYGAPPLGAKTLRWAGRGDMQTTDPHSQNENLTNNINSLGRYAFTAFPLAVMVAVAQQRLPARWRWLDRLLLPMSGVLMAGYAVAAWSGRMIP